MIVEPGDLIVKVDEVMLDDLTRKEISGVFIGEAAMFQSPPFNIRTLMLDSGLGVLLYL
mgnify:CR=1 FL=1